MVATPAPHDAARALERDVEACLREHERVDFPALPGRTNHLRAGVLVPLLFRADTALVFLEQRPTTMREHPGEISLPGGRMDPTDADLRVTALREAEEELGIRDPRVLGTLSSYPLYTSDYRLFPTVAALRTETLEPNRDEVASVLSWDLARALDAPAIDGIPWNLNGETYVCPVFDIGAPRVVFGGTAQVLYDVLGVFARATGRSVPPTHTGRFTWQDVLSPHGESR